MSSATNGDARPQWWDRGLAQTEQCTQTWSWSSTKKIICQAVIDLPIIQQYLHDEQNQLVGNSDFSLIQPTVRPRMINICVSSRIPFDPYQSVCPFLRLSMENHHVQRTFPAGLDQNHGDLPHRGFGC